MLTPGKYFVTGTDTGIGKTTICCDLMKNLNQQGYSTLGLKPIASDADEVNGQLLNDDALQHQHHASIKLPYHDINPFTFAPPISPNIAAEQINIDLNSQIIKDKLQPGLNTNVDFTLVEGVGGWLAPISDTETMADVAIALSLPVILVVGIKLGCLNHTLLTTQAIKSSGLRFAGWIANCLDPTTLQIDKNIETIEKHLRQKPLTTLKFINAYHNA